MAASNGPSALLVLLAGLPGVGKSTLAGPLAERLGAAVLDRDHVKEATIPAEYRTHSPSQVRLAAQMCADVCGTILAEHPTARLVIDGHTFSRREDLARYRQIADRHGAQMLVVECTADPAVVADRIAGDTDGLAKQRDWSKYLEVRERYEAPEGDVVTVDLSASVDPAVDAVQDHLGIGRRHG